MKLKYKKEEYEVFVLCSSAHFPFLFAVHPWIIINKKGVIERYEVLYKTNKEGSHVFKNYYKPKEGLPFFSFFENPKNKARLLKKVEGKLAQKIIKLIEKEEKTYKYKNLYKLKGPNSNTYVQRFLSEFPETKEVLPWNSFGKNYKEK